jgi:uncharacterized membrane protein YhaH (DUF805 family)
MSADATNDINFGVIKEQCIGCLKKYAVFNGRSRRQEFWIFFVAGLIVGWIPVIGWLVALAIFVPSLAVGARRLHDTDRSALLLLLLLIPLAGIIVLIVFWAQEGTHGKNKYGQDPKGSKSKAKG